MHVAYKLCIKHAWWVQPSWHSISQGEIIKKWKGDEHSCYKVLIRLVVLLKSNVNTHKTLKHTHHILVLFGLPGKCNHSPIQPIHTHIVKLLLFYSYNKLWVSKTKHLMTNITDKSWALDDTHHWWYFKSMWLKGGLLVFKPQCLVHRCKQGVW